MAKLDGYLVSSYQERLLEYLLIGELLKALWKRGHTDVEILRSEVDASGYDVVMEVSSCLRHIQLKATRRGGKRASVNANVKLASKPGGCLVWYYFDDESLDLGPFYWFGGEPGEGLPDLGDRVAKHTKADSTGLKAERPNLRLVNKGRFDRLDSIDQLLERLFGL